MGIGPAVETSLNRKVDVCGTQISECKQKIIINCHEYIISPQVIYVGYYTFFGNMTYTCEDLHHCRNHCREAEKIELPWFQCMSSTAKESGMDILM